MHAMALLVVFAVVSLVGCHSQPVAKTVERTITVKGCTEAIKAEHDDLFRENIRLKQALQVCEAKH